MKKLFLSALALLAATSAFAMDPTRVTKIGDEAFVRRETPHPVPLVHDGEPAWVDVLTWPKASYIAVHFSKFDLGPGERVVVQTPDGRYSYSFAGEGKPGLGGKFWATHVPGDTCEIHYYGNGRNPGFGYIVDKLAHGYPSPDKGPFSGLAPEQPEWICGVDDSNWAKCYQETEPQIYDQSRAIARIMIAGTGACTAWLVGCQGHILTNNHCIESASDAMNTDYEFMAEGATCATDCASFPFCPGTIVSSTGTLIATEAARDYSLVQLPVNPTGTYGYFRLRPDGPIVGERIYIPGHPAAWGKRFAVTSTDPADTSGFCQVNSLNQPSCIGGGPLEVGYMCDTRGGSSGSPVVAYNDQRVVALHHCGGCPNTAVSSSDVIAGLGANLPQCAVQQFAGTMEILADVYGCASAVSLRVHDDNPIGAGPQVVTIASTTEVVTEDVTLTEDPSGSGTFLGSIPATTGAPVHGDGMLSVANGNTLTATYIDADDGQGGMNVPRTDTATVDCAGPIIANVQATNVTGNSAVITWTTDEPADSRVTYGASAPPGTVATNGALVTSHSLLISPLTPCSLHYFSVSSKDAADNSTTSDNSGAYYTLTTGQNTAPNFPSPDTPITIPDNTPAGITSTITVPDTKTVLDVNVSLNISHTFDGDLSLTLVTPTAVSIPLSIGHGASGDNFTGTVFDDGASGPISSGAPPFTGSFQPDSPLSAANGINAAGAWTLKVVDTADIDTGTLLNWTLSLTYPPQSCGAHSSYKSRALVHDTCATGGAGNNNGIAEAGEQVQFSVTIENDGSVPLTGISATVTPVTAGVTMVQGTASYNTLAVGATGASLAPHFTTQLPPSLACGSNVDYQITITTAQGIYTGSFSTGVGQIIPAGGTALSENFSGGIPGTWTVVNGGSGGGAAATWTTANPGGRTFTAPISGPVAIVDSDNAGSSATQDEQLITPVMNLSAALTVTLNYDEFFRVWSFGLVEKGDVDVKSSLTGGAWVNVVRNQGASNPPGATTTGAAHRTVNITAQAAGAADVQIRFHYYTANYEYWWEVDNIVVTDTAPGSCNMTSCLRRPRVPGPVRTAAGDL